MRRIQTAFPCGAWEREMVELISVKLMTLKGYWLFLQDWQATQQVTISQKIKNWQDRLCKLLKSQNRNRRKGLFQDFFAISSTVARMKRSEIRKRKYRSWSFPDSADASSGPPVIRHGLRWSNPAWVIPLQRLTPRKSPRAGKDHCVATRSYRMQVVVCRKNILASRCNSNDADNLTRAIARYPIVLWDEQLFCIMKKYPQISMYTKGGHSWWNFHKGFQAWFKKLSMESWSYCLPGLYPTLDVGFGNHEIRFIRNKRTFKICPLKWQRYNAEITVIYCIFLIDAI
jgi:hypothetical protein